MTTSLRKTLALWTLLALLTGCATTKAPLLVLPPQIEIPPPIDELMMPLPPLPVNVPLLLEQWTERLNSIE